MKSLGIRKITLLSVIAVLLVIYILQLVFTGKNSVKTVLLQEDPNFITIQIASDANPINILNKNNAWFIGDKEYPADNNVITSIIESVKDIRLLGKVSTPKDNDYERYGLNIENAITVTLYKDDNVLRTVLVGKNTSAGSQSYIRLDGEKSVYLASDSFRSILSASVDSLRNKSIFRIDTSTITSVSVTSSAESFLLQKNTVPQTNTSEESDSIDLQQTDWFITIKNADSANTPMLNTSVADSSKVTSWLNTIFALSAQSWLPEEYTLPSNAPGVIVVITTDDASYTIDLYPEDEEQEQDCVASCSETPYLFTVSEFALQRLNKKSADLLKQQ